MSESPWLTIVGLGEDGPDGLSPASRRALEEAEIIMGPPRHLALLPALEARRIEWPVPFVAGLPVLLDLRGRRVAILASGDPFWFGAGSVIARNFAPGEWRALPAPSTFSLAAARLGWPLERTLCMGLHAAPVNRLRPHLSAGQNAIVLLRDGAAVAALAAWLDDLGFGQSVLHVIESVGGPNERIRQARASDLDISGIGHPVCVGLEVAGEGPAIPRSSGRPDAIFASDGQITRQPVRAITLSALAPCHGEYLWDIGAGTGSIAIEWLMSDPSLGATAIEPRADRAERIRRNADAMGMDRLELVHGAAPAALETLSAPDAVFVGGGLSQELLKWLSHNLAPGTRILANAVTLESEALLYDWQARLGGTLMRIALSASTPLGSRRGWKPAYPVVQWSVTL